MRRVEARFWDRLRPRLASERIFVERIENVVGEGTPDIHTVYRGCAAWLELKAVEAWPARPTTPVMGSRTRVRSGQKVWHAKYAFAGGQSYVALSVNAKWVYLIAGVHASECDTWTQNELVERAVAAGWDELINVLKGER